MHTKCEIYFCSKHFDNIKHNYCCIITLHTIELPDICLSLLKGPTLPRWFYSKIRDVRTLFIGWVSRDMACIFYIYIHWQNMYNTAYTNHYKLSSFFVQIHLVPLPSPGHSPLGVSDCEQLLLLAVLFLVSLREFTNRSDHKHNPYIFVYQERHQVKKY